ncbi:hypothetical protein, partial [Caldifermentibacillus hisashii]|uniref:hypothetical protein n=1 Tax=Caldifermentibacillus hisashii TaxID=996558 RepID=UPI000BD0C464
VEKELNGWQTSAFLIAFLYTFLLQNTNSSTIIIISAYTKFNLPVTILELVNSYALKLIINSNNFY